MNKNFLVVTIFIMLFTGCAEKMTTAGKQVREISSEMKSKCIFIGNEETSSATKFGSNGNKVTVLNNIRNITANNGGNSYVLKQYDSDGFGHWVGSFEMYKCKK